MENFQDLKVFKVEVSSFNYRYVIAKGFDEAANKVIAVLEHERAVDKAILDSDGSLINLDKELKIKGVELICDQIIT